MVDLPKSTGFISSLGQGGIPLTGLVLRGSHDYLEDRQPGNTPADDADIKFMVLTESPRQSGGGLSKTDSGEVL